MDVTRPNGAANTGLRYVLITSATYHSNYRERLHHSNFRKRPLPPPCWPPSIFVSITQSHLSALQNLRKCELVFFLIMTHSTKKGIILCDFSSWVNQTSTTRASGGLLQARCSETGQHSQDLHMPKILYNQSTTLDDSFFSTACPAGPHASIQDLSCHTINWWILHWDTEGFESAGSNPWSPKAFGPNNSATRVYTIGTARFSITCDGKPCGTNRIYASGRVVRAPLGFKSLRISMEHYNRNRNRNRFVPVTIDSVTICDICDQNVTKPVFLKKLTKKQRNKFGHKFKFVTICDRHKCHKLVTHSVWLVQTCFCFCLEIRLGTALRVVPSQIQT